ncbi:MAG: hypothetical protein JST10_10725 [Bacteroidetes bacterium]|nr:hypothetical protein [Bacteroidota bacterium]
MSKNIQIRFAIGKNTRSGGKIKNAATGSNQYFFGSIPVCRTLIIKTSPGSA